MTNNPLFQQSNAKRPAVIAERQTGRFALSTQEDNPAAGRPVQTTAG
jgi:hypothetical protein